MKILLMKPVRRGMAAEAGIFLLTFGVSPYQVAPE
jgi:hypothetical protein